MNKAEWHYNNGYQIGICRTKYKVRAYKVNSDKNLKEFDTVEEAINYIDSLIYKKTGEFYEKYEVPLKEVIGHKTAKKRTKLSRPMQHLKDMGELRGKILDYGCGRGDDARLLKIDFWDPFWNNFLIKDEYNTITCNYVLNVLPEKDRKDVFKKVRALLHPRGTLFVSVRSDIKGMVKGRDCVQYDVHLPDKYAVKKTKGYRMYMFFKEDIKKDGSLK